MSSLLTVLLGPFFGFHCWLLRHNMTTIDAMLHESGSLESAPLHSPQLYPATFLGGIEGNRLQGFPALSQGTLWP